jgi:hypothetical protein
LNTYERYALSGERGALCQSHLRRDVVLRYATLGKSSVM